MKGYEGFDNELGLLFDSVAGPGRLYAIERQFWLDLFRTPCLEAVEEDGIEVRHYGPVLAYAIIGSATMMVHPEGAQLGFAGTCEPARRRGAHLALIRRRIVDALAAGAQPLFAVTEEPPDYPATDSTAARNLIRAGFGLVSVRPLWRPPEELLADDEDEEDDEDELDDDDDGLDEDHDFELEG